MMYSEENFQIRYDNETISFSGSLEKTVYADIHEFLDEIEGKSTSDTLVLDFRELEFLNSTGIRMLAMFVTSSTKAFHLLFDNSITWQKPTLSAIQQIKPASIQLKETS